MNKVRGDKACSPNAFFYGDNNEADYKVIKNAASFVLLNKVEGMFCEIGIRRGYGTFVMLQQIVEHGSKRNIIGVDPYGNIPYKRRDSHDLVISNYDNSLKNNFLKNVYAYVEEKGCCNYSFFNMTDTRFFSFFNSGIPFYDNGSEVVLNTYALVHLDGPHGTSEVCKELDFFCPKVPDGGIIVIDDINVVNHEIIDKKFQDFGFVSFESNEKIVSYKRAYK